MMQAFSDIHFYYFALLVGSLLATSGLILFILKNLKPTKEAASKIWVAYKPWLVMAPLCFLSIGMGAGFFTLSLFMLSFYALKEFTRAANLQSSRALMVALYLSNLLIYISANQNWEGFLTFWPALQVVLLAILPITLTYHEGMLRKVSLSLVAILYLAWFPAHLVLFTHYPEGFIYLLFLVIGTELNDASAYLCGKLFGKTPLIPKISPQKTVEGVVGAFMVVLGYVAFVHSWVPGLNFFLSALSLLLITCGGTLGDLVMSFFKRELGVKDMGNLIPGHGGLLDRCDSLLFIAPFYFYLMRGLL